MTAPVPASFLSLALLASLSLLASAASMAASALTVAVTSADHRPVSGVVVTATALGARIRPSRERKPAVMDQVNKTFVPQVLVVAAGTAVEFPNSDSVSHQVYSFSRAKHFQLPLYKGEVHSPIQFDQPGLVVLGCNIHDSMVGYIYVADTPFFGRTGYYAGLSWRHHDQWEVRALRYDNRADPGATNSDDTHFSTHQHSGGYSPFTDDDGHGLMLAYLYDFDAHWQAVGEWQQVSSRFPPRVLYGDPVAVREKLL